MATLPTFEPATSPWDYITPETETSIDLPELLGELRLDDDERDVLLGSPSGRRPAS